MYIKTLLIIAAIVAFSNVYAMINTMNPHDEVVATVVMEASNDPREMQAIVNVIFNRAEKAHISPLEVVRGKKYGPFYGHKRIGQAKSHTFIGRWNKADALVTSAELGKLNDITGGAIFFDTKFTWGEKIGKQYFTDYFRR